MTEFTCDGATMKMVMDKLQEAKGKIDSAYQNAQGVKGDIQANVGWKADSQKVMSAFLDLLTQYHNDFTKDSDAPLTMALEELGNLQTNLANFYEEWEAYKKLENIS